VWQILAEKKNWIAKSVQQADPADLFRTSPWLGTPHFA